MKKAHPYRAGCGTRLAVRRKSNMPEGLGVTLVMRRSWTAMEP